MEQGLAKTSPSQNVISSVSPITRESPPLIFDGVPLDLMDYFQIDFKNSDSDSKNKLREIYSILKDDYPDITNLLSKLSDIDRKLGAHGYQETRYGKIWNYLKVTEKIKGLEKYKLSLEKANA